MEIKIEEKNMIEIQSNLKKEIASKKELQEQLQKTNSISEKDEKIIILLNENILKLEQYSNELDDYMKKIYSDNKK